MLSRSQVRVWGQLMALRSSLRSPRSLNMARGVCRLLVAGADQGTVRIGRNPRVVVLLEGDIEMLVTGLDIIDLCFFFAAQPP